MDAIDLVNAALRSIGSKAIATISDTTAAGEIAGDVYEPFRDALLRAHTWNFATVRTVLLASSVSPVAYGFEHAYLLPSDWLRTIEVTNNEQGTGRLPYKQEAVWTDQLLSNRLFDEDATWTKGTGWAISGGKASHAAGTGSNLSQSVSPTASGIYRVFFTISGRSAGGLAPGFTGGTSVTGTTVSTNGTSGQEITAHSGGGNNTFVLIATSDFDGSVDDVYLYRQDGATASAIVTDADEVWLRYVRKVTVVDQMSPGFRYALIWLLAKPLSTGLAASNTLRQLSDEDLKTAVRMARSVDGVEDFPDPRPEGSWIEARRGGQRGAWQW